MSRVISYTSGVTFIPTGYTNAGSYSFTSQTIANAYTDSDSNSSNRMTLARSNNSTRKSEIYYEFDTSGLENIPITAVINSISCNVKYYVNNTTYVTAILMQLYSGNNSKGTAITNRPTTGTKYSINCGTWSLSELLNARLYISGTHNAGTNNAYLYFHGADLTVNYSANDTLYEITTSSNVSDSFISPESEEVSSGGNCTIRVDTNDIENIIIEDNGVDITDLFETKINIPSGTTTKYPTGFTTDFSSSNANFYLSQYETGTTRLQYPIGYFAESPHSQSDTGYTYVKDNNQNTATGWINYKFDFSDIPENATIKSVRISAYGAREKSSTSSQYKAMFGAYCGNTLKGSTQEFTSTSNQLLTLSNIGTWTREELQDAQVRFTVAYYGGRIYGVTFEVNWETDSENPYYYEYTLTNVNEDHDIVINESIYIPPEEDPEIEYYSLTISSINATTTPKRGTTRVESGDSETITIYPSDPQVTLILDNGVDVSSQLVAHGGTIQGPIVSTAQGASYGFAYSSSTGYYVSQNKGVDKSAAVCRIDFNFPVRCLVTIQFINYAEATYDFGVFGNIDSQLNTNYYAAGSDGASITDNDYKLACNTSSYNTSSEQTLTYEIPSGEHFINIKYSKDNAASNNNDTLQFKFLSIEQLEANNYYTYTLNNINQDHSLIFIFGDVTYYFVNSSLTGDGKINPDGQIVVLPDDNYKLTIVPENPNDSVSIIDNNLDVTNNLVEKRETIEKDGKTYVVVNYIYALSNIQTGHTLNVFVQKNNLLFLKQNSGWVTVYRAYVKNDNRWNVVDNFDTLFNDGTVYIKQ